MMRLSRPLKLALLALTGLPLVYMVAFIFVLPYVDGTNFDTLFAIHGAISVLSIGLYAVYLVDLFRTTSVPRDMKALWGVALLIGSYVTMLVYWAKHVWLEPAAWPLDNVITRDDA